MSSFFHSGVRRFLVAVAFILLLSGMLHAKEMLSLVREGRPVSVILVADPNDADIRAAVDELNYWVRRISQTTLPVQRVEEWDGKTPYVAIGESSLTREKGWTTEGLGAEGARVVVTANGMALLGNPTPIGARRGSGLYFAVLECVREGLGVRWIWPGELGEVFDSSPDIRLPLRDWSWQPTIPYLRKMRSIAEVGPIMKRLEIFDLDSLSPEKFEEVDRQERQWLQRERMGHTSMVNFRGNFIPLTFGEAFKDWWARYGKSHPDWFARPPAGISQLGGHGVKLNLSHPAVQDQIFKQWLRQKQAAPDRIKYLKLTPNDSRGFDTSPETRAWDAPEMQHLSDREIWNGSEAVLTDRYVHFWNLMARRVREVDSDAAVNTLAYRNYRKPPLVETVEPNVVINYVGGEGFYPDEPWLLEEWLKWSEKGAVRKLWRPNLLHSGHGIPYLFPKALIRDFRQIEKNGLLGTDFDAMTGNWAGQGLTYYVLAEAHIRPDASYETLANEYFSAFGPARDAIQQYHEYFEEVTSRGPALLRKHRLVPYETWGGWWQGHIRLVPLLLTTSVMEEAERFLKTAEERTEDGPAVFKERVALVREGFEHARLMADTFRRLDLGNPEGRKNFAGERETLLPLWEARQKLLGKLVVSVPWLFFQEQRHFGIWDAFLKAPSGKPSTTSYPIVNGWRSKADPEDVGRSRSWQSSSPDDTWEKITLGASVPESAKGNGSRRTVWYRVRFEVPILDDTQRKVRLQFTAVDAEGHFWLNGKKVAERGYPHMGNYDSWRESFQIDISDAMKEGPDNELVICVSSEKPTIGIHGEVTLLIGD